MYMQLYVYVIIFICYRKYGFYFWSGVSTLGFGEWGIVFHVLALCLVQKTEVMRRREDFQLPATFSFSRL